MPSETTTTPEPAQGAKPKKKRSIQSRLLIVFIAVFAVVLIAIVYVALTLHSVSIPTPTVQTLPINASPGVNGTFVQQAPLLYSNSTLVVPYLQISYASSNASLITAQLKFQTTPPPSLVYVLNWSNQCYNCGNVQQVVASIAANLTSYGILSNPSQLQIVSPSDLSAIPSGSALVILNGLLPDYLLNNTASPEIGQLLNRDIQIIYVGRNFSELVSSQTTRIPNSNIPPYLSTFLPTGNNITSGFYFNQSTFAFSSGLRFGPITYETVGRGAIVAFSNYLSSWSTPAQAGSDIAKAIFLDFWAPYVAVGTTAIAPSNYTKSNGEINIFPPPVPTYALPSLEGSLARVTLTAQNGNKVAYYTFYYQPALTLNASISIANEVIPGKTFNSTVTLYTSQTSLFAEPHLDIYNTSLTRITSLPPMYSKQISAPSYTVLTAITLSLPPGHYIGELNGASGQTYAYTYFNVPPLNVSLIKSSPSTGNYTFYVTAAGVPVSNLNATVTLNGQYQVNSTITNGALQYQLPSGTTVPSGDLSFNVRVLSTDYPVAIHYAPISVSLNPQYIEFIIALMVVIMEVTLIKAPTRDEFYIDIPTLPTPQRTTVRIKYPELLGVFDKLNIYYRWRYMPLSRQEFRTAVQNNVRSGNISVVMTYNNLDAVLDSLVANGYLVSSDGMYAPTQWIEQSKHDIDYLATFKKLRIYLVSHGHIFTDLDKSDAADIVTTLHNEKAYIVIYSKTSRFMKDIPVQQNVKTYLAFLNGDRLEEFKNNMYTTSSGELEELKMYVSVGSIVLIDSDNPEEILT